ncbi:bucentaur or craniofacial development domain-containing protein [Phthorimaea operculella]|nr:bucentaur or craniofacial development domain-containing protein [Phthorimaea operculella]
MSSGSDSDEEFVPGEPEQLSEEDSADDETDLQYEKEQEHKAKKRKAAQETKGKKKRRTRNNADVEEEEEKQKTVEEKVPEPLDPEEEKKHEEDLWAKFLEGTDTKPKPKEPIKIESAKPTTQDKPATSTVQQNKEDEKARERRIFEFAGETIVVENDVIKEKIKTDGASPVIKDGPSRSRGGGLSNVLGQLNKKNKLSTLEKSKLDWNTYKKTEDIDDEIQSHNKGKAGYLDRKDFLERADLRQYEIERDLRMSRRSNR